MEKLDVGGSEPLHSGDPEGRTQFELQKLPALDMQASDYGIVQAQCRKAFSLRGCSAGSFVKKCIRSCEKARVSRFLRQVVFKAKARRLVAKNYRFIRAERLHKQPLVQDGNCDGRPERSTEGHVVNVNRPLGRLLPHSYKGEVQEVLSGGSFGQGIPISGYAHGVKCFGKNFHKSHRRGIEGTQAGGYTHCRLLGRLVNKELRPLGVKKTNFEGGTVGQISGIDSKRGKVRASSHTGDRVPGGRVQPSGGDGEGSSTQIKRHSEFHNGHNSAGGGFCQKMALFNGEVRICNVSGELGAPSSQASTEIPAMQLGTGKSGLGGVDPDEGSDGVTVTVVDELGQYEEGGVFGPFLSQSNAFHGRQSVGVRGGVGAMECIGSLEQLGDVHALEQQGAIGSSEGGNGISESVEGTAGLSVYGQYNCGGNDKQTGWHQELVIKSNNVGSMELVGRNQVPGSGEAYSGSTECNGGSVESGKSGSSVGVDDQIISVGGDLGQMGKTGGGLICDQSELQVDEVCFAFPAGGGMGGECFQPTLGGEEVVRLSPMGHFTGSVEQGMGRSSGGNFDRASVADQILVSNASQDVDGGSDSVATRKGLVNATGVGNSASEAGGPQPSSLEIIRGALTARGFSDEVAGRAARGVRPSSGYIYDSKWRVFAQYCLTEGRQPLEVDLPFVAQFFNYLFSNKEMSVSSIKGYRSALARVFRSTNGLELSDCQIIKDLFKNFSVERPFSTRQLPKWDLSIVLKSLKRPPYEPLISASLSHVSRKTAFLLLLASAARRNEIHALEHHTIVRGEGNKFWIIKPNPRFVAKNFNPVTGKGMFHGIKVRSIRHLSGSRQGEVDDTLCPIRMLRWYLHRTDSRRGGIRQLLLTCNNRGKVRPIHKNTLTSWVKKVIMDAYNSSSGEMSSMLHRAVHEIRAVAASFAIFGNVGLEQVLRQCRWSKSDTFARHYLRRTSAEDQGLMALLPMEMAGGVIRQ